jgi:hypothetical protein
MKVRACFQTFLFVFICRATQGRVRLKTGNVLKIDRRLIIFRSSRPLIDADAIVEKLLLASTTSFLSAFEGPIPLKESLEIGRAMKYLKECGEEPQDPQKQEELKCAVQELFTRHTLGEQASMRCLGTITRSLPLAYQRHLGNALRCRNGRVTDFNKVMTGVFGCNTAIYHLGSGEDSKSSMFYTVNYCTKGQGEKESTLSLAVAARTNITKYPSRAPDSGSEQRTAQHWLCRMLNSANGQQEYSKMYCALHLLMFRYEQNSHRFVSLNVDHALSSCVSFTKKMRIKVCAQLNLYTGIWISLQKSYFRFQTHTDEGHTHEHIGPNKESHYDMVYIFIF